MQKGIKKYSYYLLHKPYGYLSQFSGEENDLILKTLFNFPKDVYPVGRLDKDSEGLLLLTNDNRFKNHILDPNSKEPKTYWAQLDGEINEEAIQKLCNGSITIKHNGKPHRVKKALCCRIKPIIEERNPPIRYRKNIPTSWIELVLTEGKNRQVRKMTAAVGFPTLRLIRTKIGEFELGNMIPGEVREFQP